MKDKHKVKGICIKSYQCEDSVDEFEQGLIEEQDIKVYNVGDSHMIVKSTYNKKFWKEV